MIEYEEIIEQIDEAIENGCSVEFLEKWKTYTMRMHDEICSRCFKANCGGCKWEET